MTEDQAREIRRMLASMPKDKLNLLFAGIAERSILNHGQAVRFMMGISSEWARRHRTFTLVKLSPEMNDDEAASAALSVELYMTLLELLRSRKHTPGTLLHALAFTVHAVVNEILERHPLPQDALDLVMSHGARVIMDDAPMSPLVVEE
jgi:hypothetical protein